MVSTVADQKTQRNKWLIAHLQRMRKKRKEAEGVAVNQPPEGVPLDLGNLEQGAGVVLATADLLNGVTDPDGDALSVTSVAAVSGGTVSGTGPWTITPSATGAGSATVVISDGRGGSVNRTVTWNGVAAPAIPAISGVTGTIAHGQTITVSGSGLGQAPTLLRIAGDEGAAGTSVAAATGMTVHGTGAQWLFESGGTMVLDMQTQQPETVYKTFAESQQQFFLYFERKYSNVGPLVAGNGQVKEFRVTGDDEPGDHGDDPSTGTIWQAEYDQIQWITGNSDNQKTYGVDRAAMTQWTSQFVTGRMIGGGSSTIDYEVYGDGVANGSVSLTGTVTDSSGWGQVLLPFFCTPGFAVTLQMRNAVMLASRQRFEIGNNANRALCNRVVVQHAASAGESSASIPLDLDRFAANDGLYLFAVNANGERSAAYELRAPVVDAYDPLTDSYGIHRPTTNGAAGGTLTIPSYETAAADADSLRFQIGFTVDGLDSWTVGTSSNISLCRNASDQYRGNIRIDKTTGRIIIRSMVNNATLTLAATSDVHTSLGVRRDWELVIPKNTGELITLTDKQTGTVIGSVARTATFDGFWPTWWLYANGNTEGALKGSLPYLRCFATTSGVETTLFDFRFTAEQAGLTSVPSAHDSGVVATLGAALTWGAA